MRSTFIKEQQRQAIVRAVKLHAFAQGEFKLANGEKSDWKIEMERALLSNIGAAVIPEAMLDACKPFGAVQFAGVANGGTLVLGQMQMMARRRGLVYDCLAVSPKPDEPGGQVKGTLTAAPVIVIEDLVRTGHSTEAAIKVLTASGGAVIAVITPVDREPERPKTFDYRDIAYQYLIDINDLNA